MIKSKTKGRIGAGIDRNRQIIKCLCPLTTPHFGPNSRSPLVPISGVARKDGNSPCVMSEIGAVEEEDERADGISEVDEMGAATEGRKGELLLGLSGCHSGEMRGGGE